MNEILRRSAAHVVVDDVHTPTLQEADRHHLGRVLRLREGECVTVTDGVGCWRACELRSGALAPIGDVVTQPLPDPLVTVAVAPPKGDRLDLLVTKCTEIGVDRIVVVEAEHSVVRWTGERATRHLERLRRLAREASCQSRRVWLPEIIGPVPAASVLPGAVAAEPGGQPLERTDTVVAVGPEGGWSPDEVASASGLVSLGPNVLRVETAAIVAATRMIWHRERAAS